MGRDKREWKRRHYQAGMTLAGVTTVIVLVYCVFTIQDIASVERLPEVGRGVEGRIDDAKETSGTIYSTSKYFLLVTFTDSNRHEHFDFVRVSVDTYRKYQNAHPLSPAFCRVLYEPENTRNWCMEEEVKHEIHRKTIFAIWLGLVAGVAGVFALGYGILYLRLRRLINLE